MQAIKDVMGVTPTCWRPPYGDVDDRVRAIAQGLGLRTYMWSGTCSIYASLKDVFARSDLRTFSHPHSIMGFDTFLDHLQETQTTGLYSRMDRHRQAPSRPTIRVSSLLARRQQQKQGVLLSSLTS